MRRALGSAVVVLLGFGQSISGWQSPTIGFGLMTLGVLCALAFLVSDDRIRRRFPYALVRRSELEAALTHVTPRDTENGLDQSLREIETYLRHVNRAMEEHGFGTKRDPPRAGDMSPHQPAGSLRARLQEHLRKGRRIRAGASISSDGSCGLIEVWEQDAISTLEDANRHDLLARFEAREPLPDFFRAVVSGPWATRARMDRRLEVLSDFVREMPSEAGAAPRVSDAQLGPAF